MPNNIVDRITGPVTVWTADGNAMENRTLLTLDLYGVVVTGWGDDEKAVFVPWSQIRYIDYPRDDIEVVEEEVAE